MNRILTDTVNSAGWKEVLRLGGELFAAANREYQEYAGEDEKHLLRLQIRRVAMNDFWVTFNETVNREAGIGLEED